MTEDEIIDILHSGDLSELWKNGVDLNFRIVSSDNDTLSTTKFKMRKIALLFVTLASIVAQTFAQCPKDYPSRYVLLKLPELSKHVNTEFTAKTINQNYYIIKLIKSGEWVYLQELDQVNEDGIYYFQEIAEGAIGLHIVVEERSMKAINTFAEPHTIPHIVEYMERHNYSEDIVQAWRARCEPNVSIDY